MNFELDTAQLSQGIADAASELLADPAVREQVQEAMALRLKSIINNNLGVVGEDRPNAWAALSQKYAKRVGRAYATLYDTGRLSRSVKHASYPEYAIVYQDYAEAQYGEAHQYGEGHMPVRKFFPVQGDSLTAHSESEVIAAAAAQLMESLRRISGR